MATKKKAKKAKKKVKRTASTKRGATAPSGKTKKRNTKASVSKSTTKPEKLEPTPAQVEAQKVLYLEAFAMTARNDSSAEIAGIGITKAYKWCNADKNFAEGMIKARVAARQVLEDAAVKRGVSGVARALYHKGEYVANEQVYSDGLLQFVMKGADPEKYRDRSAVQHTGADDGPIRSENGLTRDTAEFIRQEVLGILKK